jgi:hypothetical protein
LCDAGSHPPSPADSGVSDIEPSSSSITSDEELKPHPRLIKGETIAKGETTILTIFKSVTIILTIFKAKTTILTIFVNKTTIFTIIKG